MFIMFLSFLKNTNYKFCEDRDHILCSIPFSPEYKTVPITYLVLINLLKIESFLNNLDVHYIQPFVDS